MPFEPNSRRVLQLFRAWIPSWRFFETLIEQPVLFYRIVSAETSSGDGSNQANGAGEWQLALRRPPRSLFSVVLNAEGNLHLACYTLLDQLEEDIGDLNPAQLDSFSQSPSYQLVQNLVCFVLRERHQLSAGTRYQFKVSRQLARETPEFEDILVSPVHSV
jgi:hypothetical protein